MMNTSRNSSMTGARRFARLTDLEPTRTFHICCSSSCHALASSAPASPPSRITVNAFMQTLRVQRWDDHRFYHHSLVNQSLHLISAITFMVAYGLLFVDPAIAAILAWCVSMTTRQAGHFFFEPRGYDHVNQVTDDYKEDVKVGYNIRRKIVLMGAWVLIPGALWFEPSLFGLIQPAADMRGFVHDVGVAWLCLGVSGLVFRVLQLWITQGLVTGLAWGTKIVTDPFNDFLLYRRAPLQLARQWMPAQAKR
jgi:hypothetical protein